MLTACNVPETDYTDWSAATAYVVGNRCLYAHKIYYCNVNHTNAQPDTNTSGVTPKWTDEGYDNRWKMFDQLVGSQTAQATSITLTIVPGLIDSIAFLDLEATSIEIVMTDPTAGEVYHETLDLISGSHIVDAYTYFLEPIILTDAAVLLGIPAYGAASIAITISNPGGTARVGTLVAGMQYDLGGTQYSPTIGITDYSSKTTDTFGNYTIVERVFSKRMSCELFLENTSVDSLQRTLASYRATPVVWIGTDIGFSSMIIYGFFKSFSIVIPYLNNSTCSIEIEGLS
jgi:hypothetical protein